MTGTRTRLTSLLIVAVALSLAGCDCFEQVRAQRQQERLAELRQQAPGLWEFDPDVPDMLMYSSEKPVGDLQLRIVRQAAGEQLSYVLLYDACVHDAGLDALSGLDRLRVLGLTDAPISDAGIDRLHGLDSLEQLGLKGTRVQGRSLQRFVALRTLILRDCPIDDLGLEKIAQLPNVETLCLDRTKITGAGLRHLERMKTLKTLSLEGCNVSRADVERLVLALGLDPKMVTWDEPLD